MQVHLTNNTATPLARVATDANAKVKKIFLLFMLFGFRSGYSIAVNIQATIKQLFCLVFVCGCLFFVSPQILDRPSLVIDGFASDLNFIPVLRLQSTRKNVPVDKAL